MLIIPFLSKKKTNQEILSIGNKERQSSLTDVAFISESRVVCLDRQEKILYLLKIDKALNTFNILQELKLQFNPDLMEVSNKTIYIVNLNQIVTMCELISDSFISIIRTIELPHNNQYHGICINPNNIDQLFLAGTRGNKVITIYETLTNRHKDYIIPRLENSNLKDIVFVDSNHVLIIASDGAPKSSNHTVSSYTSYINLYEYNSKKFTFLDGMTYENCHVDSIVFTKGIYFVTAQLNDIGYIMNGQIEDKYIIPSTPIKVDDFPHGLAISKCENYLAYTCYSTSSLYIDKVKNMYLSPRTIK